MILAGLWDETTYAESEPLMKSYTIITVDSNPQLKYLHDRMPAILNSKDIELWLSDARWKDVAHLIKSFGGGKLDCYKVNPEVGNVRNDKPDFVIVCYHLFYCFSPFFPFLFSRLMRTYSTATCYATRRDWVLLLKISHQKGLGCQGEARTIAIQFDRDHGGY